MAGSDEIMTGLGRQLGLVEARSYQEFIDVMGELDLDDIDTIHFLMAQMPDPDLIEVLDIMKNAASNRPAARWNFKAKWFKNGPPVTASNEAWPWCRRTGASLAT